MRALQDRKVIAIRQGLGHLPPSDKRIRSLDAAAQTMFDNSIEREIRRSAELQRKSEQLLGRPLTGVEDEAALENLRAHQTRHHRHAAGAADTEED